MPKECYDEKQWVEQLYQLVLTGQHPERVIKEMVSETRKRVSSTMFYGMLSNFYVRLSQNDGTKVWAKYVKDLYGYGAMVKYFPAEEEPEMVLCGGNPDVEKLEKELLAYKIKYQKVMAEKVRPQIIVNGDYVESKHVEYEIGNVESGGIGIQIMNGMQKASVPAKDGRKKPVSTSKQVDDTFRYVHIEHEEGSRRVTKLYQLLCKIEWLDADTKPDTFRSFFTGEPKSFTMKWTGAQADLYHLIKELTDRGLLTCPKGARKWQVTGSHFLDAKSRPFIDWNKQKKNVKTGVTIQKLADLLDISIPMEDMIGRNA